MTQTPIPVWEYTNNSGVYWHDQTRGKTCSFKKERRTREEKEKENN